MKNIKWDNIDEMSDSEITYLLYTEGRDIKAICRIRNMERSVVERQIIENKIKYRIFEESSNIDDIVKKLIRCSRDERKSLLVSMDKASIQKLENYALRMLFNSIRDECTFYIWLLGELKTKKAVPSLITFLKCSDGNIKRLCCSALGKIGDPAGETALINCLCDDKPQVREYAVKALGKLKSKNALSYMEAIVSNDNEKEYVKRSAREILAQVKEW